MSRLHHRESRSETPSALVSNQTIPISFRNERPANSDNRIECFAYDFYLADLIPVILLNLDLFLRVLSEGPDQQRL